MPLHAFEHVQVAMPPGEEPAARAFYSGVLGLSEVPKPARIAARGGCWFEAGTIRLHLGVDHDFRPARKAHPAFVVDHLEDLIEGCRAAGIEVEEDHLLDDYDRAFVHDPFGNRIELMEPKPARP